MPLCHAIAPANIEKKCRPEWAGDLYTLKVKRRYHTGRQQSLTTRIDAIETNSFAVRIVTTETVAKVNSRI